MPLFCVQVIIRSHCITSFPESITNLSFSREVLHHVVLRGYIVGPAQKEHLNTLDFEFHHLGSIDAKTPQKDAASEKDHIVDGNFSCSIYTCQTIDQHVFLCLTHLLLLAELSTQAIRTLGHSDHRPS